MKEITVLLVEDNKLIRVGIQTLLEQAEGFKVCAAVSDGKSAINSAIEHKPDIILLDIGLSDMQGSSVMQKLKEKEIYSKIIILTGNLDEQDIIKCLSLGAFAYVIKDINTDMLLNIIKSVNSGAMWLDPKIVPIIRNRHDNLPPKKHFNRSEFKEAHFNLTQREYEVLKLIVDGKSNSDIAKTLCISEHTAKAHVCNIMQKLVVDDRTQAAVKALKEGIV